MEATSITGVFAGYDLALGCRLHGIYVVWSIEEFIDSDLSSTSCVLARKQIMPHITKAIELPEEGMCFPLKSEYDLRWKV